MIERLLSAPPRPSGGAWSKSARDAKKGRGAGTGWIPKSPASDAFPAQ